jgi:hypothetical protein
MNPFYSGIQKEKGNFKRLSVKLIEDLMEICLKFVDFE